VTRQSEQQQQQGDTTSSAAETLSHLAQAAAAAQQPQPPPGPPVDPSIHPQLQGGHEPGPSSHPNGPPSLGMPSQPSQPEASTSSPTLSQTQLSQADDVMKNLVASMASGSGGRRRSANPMVGTEEWRQQRKNNHVRVDIIIGIIPKVEHHPLMWFTERGRAPSPREYQLWHRRARPYRPQWHW
jgi:hypothetical protein